MFFEDLAGVWVLLAIEVDLKWKLIYNLFQWKIETYYVFLYTKEMINKRKDIAKIVQQYENLVKNQFFCLFYISF